MTRKGVYVCALAAVVAAACLAMPPPASEVYTVQVPTLQLKKTSATKGATMKAVSRMTRQGRTSRTVLEGAEHVGSMVEDQRDVMAKQILRMILENMNKEGCFGDHPFSDRDYQGWMDFGRRSLEKQERH